MRWRARHILVAAGVEQTEAKLPAALDPAARCARVAMVPAGLAEIVVRGPEEEQP